MQLNPEKHPGMPAARLAGSNLRQTIYYLLRCCKVGRVQEDACRTCRNYLQHGISCDTSNFQSPRSARSTSGESSECVSEITMAVRKQIAIINHADNRVVSPSRLHPPCLKPSSPVFKAFGRHSSQQPFCGDLIASRSISTSSKR